MDSVPNADFAWHDGEPLDALGFLLVGQLEGAEALGLAVVRQVEARMNAPDAAVLTR